MLNFKRNEASRSYSRRLPKDFWSKSNILGGLCYNSYFTFKIFKKMNDLEKFGTQLETLIKQGIDAGSELFTALVDWSKRHSFGLTLAFGTALSQYIGSRGKNWVPLAIVGTLILQVSKEIAEEKGLKT